MKPLLFFISAYSLLAQNSQPEVVNAHLSTQAFSGRLTDQIRSGQPSWFGYAVPAVGDHNQSCCWYGSNQYGSGPYGCNLENGSTAVKVVDASHLQKPIPLEGSKSIAVLFRVAGNRVEKVQAFSSSCPLDAGGLSFVWITGVPVSASLDYLPSLLTADALEHLTDGSIMAIAQHDDAQADAVLERLTGSSQPEKIREKTVFWLGASRGERGVIILKNILAHDSSDQVRDKAVFALSISKQPEALKWLIDTAKSDPSPHVRSQALFWLSQKAGKQAESAITNAIQNDPDTEVKKKAVFALSQLPKDDSIPKLIEVAQNQQNGEVRKQAFFWLGQSNDPRALAFIEKVLTK